MLDFSFEIGKLTAGRRNVPSPRLADEGGNVMAGQDLLESIYGLR